MKRASANLEPHHLVSSPGSPGAPSSPRPRRPLSTSSASSNSPAFFAVTDDNRRPMSRKGSLPLYTGDKRRGGGGTASALLARVGSGKARWIVLAGLALVVYLWRSSGSGVEVERVGASGDKATAPTPTTRAPPRPLLVDEIIPKDRPQPPRPKPGLPAPPRPDVKPAAIQVEVVDVNVRPLPAYHASSRRPTERYLAYSPHSGYHNQRISLENALTLAFILDRTLLVPPVWVGHAIPYISFDKLGRRLDMASKDGLMERCREFGDGGSEDPLPRECEGFFDWTKVGWEFLIDLSAARELVPTVDRWNQTDAWLEEELGIRGKGKKTTGRTKGDTYYLRDDTMYQYRFYDSPEDKEPLAKFENRLDIGKLAEDSKDYKLLHVGSLFGTSRVRTVEDANFDARSTFRQATVFRNPLIDEITETIRDRLGGTANYYGLHLRVGDGVFQKQAKSNMAGVWESLCKNKMKLDESVCDEVIERSARRRGGSAKVRRDVQDDSTLEVPSPETSSTSTTSLVKRANSRPQREGAYNHAPLPALPVITSLATSPLSSSLTCRGKLHTLSHLLPFNAPLFIATDSKLPTADPNLSLFFDTFPCTFILNDFSSPSPLNNHQVVLGLVKLTGLRNEEDKVPLAQFLYPQLDAQISAYGRHLVGTPQSTYSRFAVDVLYQVYHGWDIVERG